MDNLPKKPFRLQDPEHEALRSELVVKYGTSHHMCGTFTRIFAERFPSLRRVPGYYYDRPDGWSHGEHWWLVDQAGRIIDPTADQFPTREQGHYVAYDPRLHCLPKGKCPCCCASLYSSEGQVPCSPGCDEELAREYELEQWGGPYESNMEFETDLDLVLKYGCKFTKVAPVAQAIEVALRELGAQQPVSQELALVAEPC